MDERPAETSAEHIALAQEGIATDAASSPAPAIRAALHIGAAIAISLQEAVDQLREINKELAPVTVPVREPVDPEGPRPPSVGEPDYG